eukprot:g20804.t1
MSFFGVHVAGYIFTMRRSGFSFGLPRRPGKLKFS